MDEKNTEPTAIAASAAPTCSQDGAVRDLPVTVEFFKSIGFRDGRYRGPLMFRKYSRADELWIYLNGHRVDDVVRTQGDVFDLMRALKIK